MPGDTSIMERLLGEHDTRMQERLHANEERLTMRLDVLNESVQRVERLLTGNGEPAKGLVVRVDRLEQTEVRRSWQIRALAVAILGTVGEMVMGWIRK